MFGLIFVQACCFGEQVFYFKACVFNIVMTSFFWTYISWELGFCLVWFTSALFHMKKGKEKEKNRNVFQSFIPFSQSLHLIPTRSQNLACLESSCEGIRNPVLATPNSNLTHLGGAGLWTFNECPS